MPSGPIHLHPSLLSIYKYRPIPLLLPSIPTRIQLLFLILSSASTLQPSTMSTCGNCDCADKSQCTKKGSGYTIDIVQTEKSYVESVVMEVPAAENDGKCKCGASCSCVNCTCGGH